MEKNIENMKGLEGLSEQGKETLAKVIKGTLGTESLVFSGLESVLDNSDE